MTSPQLQLELGRKLRNLRRQSGLSTRRLSSELRWSQSKLSKLENAQRTPKPIDVDRLLRVLDVDEVLRQRLVDDAWQIRIDPSPLQARRRKQAGLVISTELERGAKVVRAVSSTFLPMQAQTGEYIRAVHRQGGSSVDERLFVTNKLARQQIHRGRSAVKIFDYQLLFRPILPPEQWVHQLHRLRRTVFADRVEIGMTMPEAVVPVAPNTTVIYDDDSSLQESVGLEGCFDTDLDSVRRRLDQFDELCSKSLWGSELLAVLDDVIRFWERPVVDVREQYRTASSRSAADTQ